MVLNVMRFENPPTIDANWDKPSWADAPAARIGNFMGEKPEHFPIVEAKLGYDDSALYAVFRVEDRYVRAVAENHQGNVCRDSCVEFFFTPATDGPEGYFNLEMNCGGTMLFHFQKQGRDGRIVFPESDLSEILVAHSMPKIVEPEIEDSVTWTVEYRIPADLLEKYYPVARPAPGVSWRGNLYKCGDKTSHPHWLTWSPVDYPRPNFHVPDCFGELRFI